MNKPTERLLAGIKQELEGYTCKICNKCVEAMSRQILEICDEVGLKFADFSTVDGWHITEIKV